MTPPLVSITHAGSCTIATLNRPGRRNAINRDMYGLLTEALTEAQRSTDTTVFLIRAEGSVFCAGNDIADLKTVREIPVDQRPGYRFMQRVADFDKVLVAEVQGDAVGIGATLLLHCDFVYMSDSATLHLPFARLGLVPEFASTRLLPEVLGIKRTLDLLLLRGTIDAGECLEHGLVTELTASNTLRSLVEKRLASLQSLAPDTLLATKRLVRGPGSALAECIATETEEMNRCLAASSFLQQESGNAQ